MKEQKLANGILARVSKDIDYPLDAVFDIPAIRLTGRFSALAENCRGILFYSSDRLVLDMGEYQACINGEKLTLRGLSRAEMMIEGNIKIVCFDDKEETLSVK